MARPSDHPGYNSKLEIVNVKQFLDDIQVIRDAKAPTPGNQSLSEIFTPLQHDDPLFADSAPVIHHLRALPEPFRSKLLAKLITSLPPEHFMNLERLDPDLVRMLRHSEAVDEVSAEPDGLHAHPYMSNVQYSSGFFTSESDPVRHTARHDGRYFVLPDKEQELLLPEGLPSSVEDEFTLTQRRALMIRAEVRDIVSRLESFRLMSRAWAQAQLAAPAASPGGGAAAGPEWAAVEPLEPAFGGKAIAVAAAEARAGVEATVAGGDAATAATTGAAVDVTSEAWEEMPEEVAAEAMALALEAARGARPACPEATVLVGPQGIGKTCALLQVVRYARAHGWLTVYVPLAYHLTHRGRVLTPSRAVYGDYDQNDLATELLAALQAAHGAQLEQVPQRGAYNLDLYLPEERDAEMVANIAKRVAAEEDEVASLKAEAEARGEAFDPSTDWSSTLQQELSQSESLDRRAEGFTLLDMLKWGLAHPPQATMAAVALLGELHQVEEFPVMIAVDGVNELYEASGYPSPDGRRISTKRLPLVKALQAFNAYGYDDEHHAFRRGVFVGAASMSRNKRPTLLRETPPGSSANVPMRNRLQLSPLSRSEVHSQMMHYAMTGRFPELPARADVDSHAVEVFRTLSSGLPLEVRKAAITQF
jgi:hypothetical protein